MKIGMIGDSHLAMMLTAQKDTVFKELDIIPVTWPQQFANDFLLQGTDLCATDPGLAAFWARGGLPPKIDLTAFDRLVFVSFTVTAFNAFPILRDHAVTGWKDSKPVVRALNSPMGSPGSRSLVTPNVFKQCLAGIIRENHTYKFIDQIRQHSAIPITVVPAPYLAEDALKHRPKLWGLKRVLRVGDGAALAQSLHDAHQIAFGAFADVAVLRQPEDTVVKGCLTDERFREGASRFGKSVTHEVQDIIHAGPALGKLFLNEIKSMSVLA